MGVREASSGETWCWWGHARQGIGHPIRGGAGERKRVEGGGKACPGEGRVRSLKDDKPTRGDRPLVSVS